MYTEVPTGQFGTTAENLPINVVSHGADRTGATSSASAFIEADTQAGPSGQIWVPAGTYNIGSEQIGSADRMWVFLGEVALIGGGNVKGNVIKFRPFGMEISRDLDWRMASGQGTGLIIGDWVAFNQDDPGPLATLRLFPNSAISPTQLAVEPYFGDYTAGDRPETTLVSKGNGEDLCSIGLGSAGIKGDNSEERLVFVNKFKTGGENLRHYDISVINTFNGQLHPLFLNMGASTLLKLAENGTVNFWNSDKLGRSSKGNTVVNVQNPPKTNGIRLAARANGSTGIISYDGGVEQVEARFGGFGVVIGTAGLGTTAHRLEAATENVTQTAFATTLSNAGYSGECIRINVSRTKNSAFSFMTARALGDLTFNLRGDGSAFADGTWNGGGADYAEYFEWADGNPNNEDRTGQSVVLEGSKIRIAAANEEPLGVVSATAFVVGDSDTDFWKGKYLRDDLGRYITESVEVLCWSENVPEERVDETIEREHVDAGEDGKPVTHKWKEEASRLLSAARTVEHSYPINEIPQGVVVPSDVECKTIQRRKLNPAFDATASYKSREVRGEWSPIGLLGKLRLLKGQPTGARWIKMRDVSATVEEWMVK